MKQAGAIVIGPEDDAADLGEHERAGALGARLEGDVERRLGQPVLAGALPGAVDTRSRRTSRACICDRLGKHDKSHLPDAAAAH